MVERATAGVLNWSSHGVLDKELADADRQLAPIRRAIAATPRDASGGTDILRFGAGIAADEISGQREGYSLVLRIDGTTDRITLRDWYLADSESTATERRSRARWTESSSLTARSGRRR